MMKKMFSIILSSFFIVVAVLVILFVFDFENKMLFPGQVRESEAVDLARWESAEILERKLKSGEKVEAFYVERPSAKGTIIFAHGNGELIDDWIGALTAFASEGYNLLIPEYRGYGRSGGKPSEKNIVDDYIYFYDLIKERNAKGHKFIFFGRSLGGGVIGSLSKVRKAHGLILQSTFSSLGQLVFEMMKVPSFFIRNKFDSINNFKSYEEPVLVVHGDKDKLIPKHHGEALFKSLSGDKELHIYKGGHNDIPSDESYNKAINQLLKKVMNPS